jgi:hypothetical protein
MVSRLLYRDGLMPVIDQPAGLASTAARLVRGRRGPAESGLAVIEAVGERRAER